MRQRSDKLPKPILSKKDEGVPDGYIGVFQYFVDSDKFNHLFGVETATKLRKNTYNNVLKLFNEYGSSHYEKLWNIHIPEIVDLKLNEYANFKEIKDLCYYMECFSSIEKVSKGIKRYRISFGFKMSKLEEYYSLKEKSVEQNIPFIPPKANKRFKDDRDKLVVDFGLVYMPFNKIRSDGTSNNTPIPRNALARRFNDWKMLKELSLYEACNLAMKTVMENYPVDGLSDLENYEILTVFDKCILKKKNNNISPIKIIIDVKSDIVDMADKILIRWNADPLNQHKMAYSRKQYIEDAIAYYNSKMPLKYSNPKLLKDLDKIKEQEKIIKGG